MRIRTLLPALALALAACAQGDETASADSALNTDLTLAAQSAPVQPTIADTALSVVEPEPAAPAPRRAAPRPQPRPAPARPAPQPQREEPAPAPAPRTGTVAAGTRLALSTGSRVCTGAARPGDKIVATLTSAAVGSNGAVIPAGSKAVVEVASATSGADGAEPTLTFRVRSIQTPDGASYSAAGDVATSVALERVRAEESSTKSDAKKVIGGAILGALAGQAMGKDTKSTVIGAAAGAAAGTVAAKATAKYESCLPAGAGLTLTLSDPIQIPLS